MNKRRYFVVEVFVNAGPGYGQHWLPVTEDLYETAFAAHEEMARLLERGGSGVFRVKKRYIEEGRGAR